MNFNSLIRRAALAALWCAPAFGGQQVINTTPGQADTAPSGAAKINANFTELYSDVSQLLQGYSITAYSVACNPTSNTQTPVSCTTLPSGFVVPTANLSGTLNAAQEPAFTGDVTKTAGSVATTVTGIHGAAIPASAIVLSSNSSSQLTTAIATGSGNVVLSTSPTLVTPNLGTPTAVTLTNATGLPLSTGVTGLLSTSNLGFSSNLNMGGASSAATSFLFQNGSYIYGTGAVQAGNSILSPYNLYIGGDTVDTTTAGNGQLFYLSMLGSASTGHKGARTGIQGEVAITGTPAVAPGQASYVGVSGITTSNSNLTGTSGAYANYAGDLFGMNSNVYLQSGATYLKGIQAAEFDTSMPTGTSAADHYGITSVLIGSHAVRGTYDDAAFDMNAQDSVTQTWKYGIEFGSYAHAWAFGTDSTLIFANQRQTGPTSNSVALNGVDFSNVTFGGCAFKSTGFCVSGNGVVTLANFTVSTLPTCNSSTNKYGQALVTDSTAATYNGTPTGGGSVVARVVCNGTGWVMQ